MIEEEHFVPVQGLDLAPYLKNNDFNAAHHLIRYHWALKIIADRRSCKRILDVA
jgi:hypothetical protein